MAPILPDRLEQINALIASHFFIVTSEPGAISRRLGSRIGLPLRFSDEDRVHISSIIVRRP
jgi:hypothetical protein